MPKQAKSILPLLLLLFPLIFGQDAGALQLTMQSKQANPGDTITVNISVEQYYLEQVAAAAFTLSYRTDLFTLNAIESDFFDTFQNQWNSLDTVPSPLPPTSKTVESQTYDRPLLQNTITGRTVIVGARVKAGTPATLFTLHFTISGNTPPGIYPLIISPVIVNNEQAGYSSSGKVIPVLIDSIEGETDPALSFPGYFPQIANGAVTVQAVVVDSDNDGICDDWELLWFGDLTTATKTSDFDKDGYSDLQEYLNNIAFIKDPLGEVFNPQIKNAPGGIGYNPHLNNKLWLLTLPISFRDK